MLLELLTLLNSKCLLCFHTVHYLRWRMPPFISLLTYTYTKHLCCRTVGIRRCALLNVGIKSYVLLAISTCGLGLGLEDLATASWFWPRPQPQSFGLGLSFGLRVLASFNITGFYTIWSIVSFLCSSFLLTAVLTLTKQLEDKAVCWNNRSVFTFAPCTVNMIDCDGMLIC